MSETGPLLYTQKYIHDILIGYPHLDKIIERLVILGDDKVFRKCGYCGEEHDVCESLNVILCYLDKVFICNDCHHQYQTEIDIRSISHRIDQCVHCQQGVVILCGSYMPFDGFVCNKCQYDDYASLLYESSDGDIDPRIYYMCDILNQVVFPEKIWLMI